MILPRRAVGGLLASTLFVAGLAVASPADAARQPIRSQWYLDSSGITELHARGLDGTGVQIANIDAVPDLSVPELAGADVTVTDLCKQKLPSTHGTNTLAVMASPDYGWAPKASYHVYAAWHYSPGVDPDKWATRECPKKDGASYATLINLALDDGADIITIQVEQGGVTPTGYALVRAAEMGVPVIAAAGNDGHEINGFAGMNTIATVGAVDKAGKYATFSSWGPSLTVMAPGTGFKVLGFNDAGGYKVQGKKYGTSLSAPMVAGALALAKQAWPNANGNQLIRSMLQTAKGSGEWDQDYGWGTLNAVDLVGNDPSGLETTNPLTGRDDIPTEYNYQRYVDGLVSPSDISSYDSSYVYRGTNQLDCDHAKRCELGTSPALNSASPTPTPDRPAAAPALPRMPIGPFAVGGTLILLSVIGVVGWLLWRKRRRT